MTIGRKLVGDPFSESEESYVKMYIAACFNKKPPIPHATVHTWNINIMLDFLQKYGSNSKLSANQLAGKLALLLMFSQMCRIGEIQQLDLNHMQDVVGEESDCVEFILPKLTKTFNTNTYKVLHDNQFMHISKLQGNDRLCPLVTLRAYLRQTELIWGDVTNVFMLVTVCPPHAASAQTLSRWAKTWLTRAGLLGATAQSCCSATTSSALLMGLNIDQIVAKVSWSTSSTFVHHYLKPFPYPRSGMLTRRIGNPSRNICPIEDPHLFSNVWRTDSIRGRHKNRTTKVTNFIASGGATVSQSERRCKRWVESLKVVDPVDIPPEVKCKAIGGCAPSVILKARESNWQEGSGSISSSPCPDTDDSMDGGFKLVQEEAYHFPTLCLKIW